MCKRDGRATVRSVSLRSDLAADGRGEIPVTWLMDEPEACGAFLSHDGPVNFQALVAALPTLVEWLMAANR